MKFLAFITSPFVYHGRSSSKNLWEDNVDITGSLTAREDTFIDEALKVQDSRRVV